MGAVGLRFLSFSFKCVLGGVAFVLSPVFPAFCMFFTYFLSFVSLPSFCSVFFLSLSVYVSLMFPMFAELVLRSQGFYAVFFLYGRLWIYADCEVSLFILCPYIFIVPTCFFLWFSYSHFFFLFQRSYFDCIKYICR